VSDLNTTDYFIEDLVGAPGCSQNITGMSDTEMRNLNEENKQNFTDEFYKLKNDITSSNSTFAYKLYNCSTGSWDER